MAQAPRTHRRRNALLALAATMFAALCVLAAGCGGGHPSTDVNHLPGTATTPRAPEPALPFPPTANEPATSKGGGATPAGKVIRIGGKPEGIAVDAASGALGVSLNDRAHGFAIFDAGTLALRRTVPLLAGARHVSDDASRGRFLVPLEDVGMLAEVPAGGTPSGGGNASPGSEPTYVKTGDHPHNAATAGSDILVANEFGDSLTVIAGGKVRATVPVDVQPGGVADVGEGKVAVISVRAYTIKLLDLKTLQTGPAQNAGYGPSHAVGTPDGRALVADTRGGNVLVYESRPRLKFIQRLHLGGSPYGMAIDVARQRLWVADSGADKLYEISTAGKLKVISTKPTVRQPNTVAVNPTSGQVYVASQASGQLEQITP